MSVTIPPSRMRARVATALAALSLFLPVSAPHAAEPVGAIPGALVLAGGGPLPEAVRDRFLELAGGKKARLVVLATTDGPDPIKRLEPWRKQAPLSVALVHLSDRATADDPRYARQLADATGAWLESSDPKRMAAVYRGTAVECELRQLLTRGGVVGGDGTAAAVLGPIVFDGLPRHPGKTPALDLLPGTIIEPFFLQRNRVNRLLAGLTAYPGYAGLGIDVQTAVVVQKRQLSVVGDSYAALCLAPGAGRPTSVRMLKAGDKGDLIALSRSAVARTQPPFPPAHPEPPFVAHGTLFIGGGGRLAMDIWKRFITLAGGPNALIVVVPTANGDPVPADPVEARMLRKAGATNVKILHTRSRAEADREQFWAPLKEAKGVWFSGGRQWRFVDAYAGTATERAFHAVLARGGVIGGSSAGASIQSEYMPRGDPLGNRNIIAEGYERGFGFLKGAAVDQHFFKRNRPADMTELMDAYPQLLGIGIDEGTVAVVHGRILEVIGASKIAAYDRRKPVVAGKPDHEELPPGACYDLVARKRVEKR
jgi:cyanophycinase